MTTQDVGERLDKLAAENAKLKARNAELEGNTEEQTVESQIAEAEASGDWVRATTLKVGQWQEAPAQPEVEAPTDETAQAITEAEQSGEWSKAMTLRLQASGQGHLIPPNDTIPLPD